MKYKISMTIKGNSGHLRGLIVDKLKDYARVSKVEYEWNRPNLSLKFTLLDNSIAKENLEKVIKEFIDKNKSNCEISFFDIQELKYE